jgi:hypothetical protein
MKTISSTTREMAHFELRHKRFDFVEEFSGGWMRNSLQVKLPLEGHECLVEFLRLDHGPWDDD